MLQIGSNYYLLYAILVMLQSQLSDRVATRMQGLSLWTSGMKLHEVMKITGLTCKALYNIRKRAMDQGFNPKVDAKI